MKVGDYVRTKWGTIAQINECLGKDVGYKNMEHYEVDRLIGLYNDFILYENDIKKSDPEIIHLVEVGDYINGVEVINLADGIHLEFANNVSYVDVGLSTYRDGHVEGIKSIVTKEQFESMQYKVGEN